MLHAYKSQCFPRHCSLFSLQNAWVPMAPSKQLPSTSSTLGTAVSLSLLKEEGWLLENLAAKDASRSSFWMTFANDPKRSKKQLGN